MRAHVLPLLAAFALLLVGGCSNNVGPDGPFIGGPCADEFDCVTGTFCLRGGTFPDGTCTRVCAEDGDCRGASACVDIEAGACLLTCEVDEDCGREGYRCQEQARRDGLGMVRVCRG